MKTILFQGDSITDAERNYSVDSKRGLGYPTLISADMGYRFPGEFSFINRGVSGNRIVDVYSRIKIDIINLRPDVMTLLIGVNDVWHELSRQNGVDSDKFARICSMLIEEIHAALPDCRIVLLEPFVLRGTATEENWDYFRSEVEKRAARVREIAGKYSLDFIPLQNRFDELCEKAPADYWLVDGVHPTSAGHGMIAAELTPVLESILLK